MAFQYSKSFIALQVKFARKIASLTGEPVEDILLNHTVIRAIHLFHLRTSDPNNPFWQMFVRGIPKSENLEDWAYEFYLCRQKQLRLPRRRDPRIEFPENFEEDRRIGCFSCSGPGADGVVEIHFSRDESGKGTINKARMEMRKSELKRLFEYVKETSPTATRVRGGSWLYNIEAYRRLFPPAYINSAQPHGYPTNDWALWGQFVARDGSSREPASTQFLDCLSQQKTVDGCLKCFPFQVLRPECPIEAFYTFYEIRV